MFIVADLVSLTINISVPYNKTQMQIEIPNVLPRPIQFVKAGIPLKPVLGGARMLHFPLVLMNRLNKTESAVFYTVGSLYF